MISDIETTFAVAILNVRNASWLTLTFAMIFGRRREQGYREARIVLYRWRGRDYLYDIVGGPSGSPDGLHVGKQC